MLYDEQRQRYGISLHGEAASLLFKPSCLLYGVAEAEPVGRAAMITANVRKTANALVYAAMCGQVDCVRNMLDFSPSLVHPGVRCEDDFMGPGVQAHHALDVACEYWMLPRNDKGTVSDRKLGGDVVDVDVSDLPVAISEFLQNRWACWRATVISFFQ